MSPQKRTMGHKAQHSNVVQGTQNPITGSPCLAGGGAQLSIHRHIQSQNSHHYLRNRAGMSGAYNLKGESTLGDRSYSQSALEGTQPAPLPSQPTYQNGNHADESTTVLQGV